jgi:hypothetical protein
MTFNYDLNFQHAVEPDVSMMDVLVDLQFDDIDRHDHLNLALS